MAHRVVRFQDGRVAEVTANATRAAPAEIVW
jgi:hypothetical protein